MCLGQTLEATLRSQQITKRVVAPIFLMVLPGLIGIVVASSEASAEPTSATAVLAFAQTSDTTPTTSASDAATTTVPQASTSTSSSAETDGSSSSSSSSDVTPTTGA